MNILEKLQNILSSVVGNDNLKIDESTVLDELGLDSIDKANILFEVETQFNIQFTDEEMATIKTIKQLITTIESKN